MVHYLTILALGLLSFRG